eukprot:609676-Heterocapsa_arctica.AAC.1
MFFLEDSVKAKHNFEVLTFDLQCASANIAKSIQEQEQMQVIIDKRPAVAINGDQEEPVDQNLLNSLIRRCREVNDEVRVFQDQLA